MGVVEENEKVSISTLNQMMDSLLNVGFHASFVIDKNTNEIIYQNKKAYELVGDRTHCRCYQLFYTKKEPCEDCPITSLGAETFVVEKYENLLGQDIKWEFSNIRWTDGREVVLATVLEMRGKSEAEAAAAEAAAVLRRTDREIDSLTQIPNYLRFYAGAERAIGQDAEGSYAVIIFDIDRFKGINDLYGMLNGDRALKFIAGVLKEAFPNEENYARLHSDWFAFYIKYNKKGDIIKVIEKIRKKICANDFDFDINTSFGVYLIKDPSVPVNLMCDRAMMAAKTIKGDSLKFCAFYDEQYREEMLKADEIERSMYQALKNREFKMYLQPKYRLSDLGLCGAEVLARWVHPKKGLLAPADFISQFEKNGFILKLDEYMWEEACRTLCEWRDSGRRMIPLSVNISRYHVENNDLVKVFSRLLKQYDLTPDLLHLEITESMLGGKTDALNKVLCGLQKMGFSIEVDDFGTGFSSLNLIRNIAVDTIKIDRDFLDSKIASDKGKIVVNHTIDMAKDLKLQVIAEGVETKEHVEFLKKSHCDIAQGFYFARPMPLEEFNKYSF